MVSYIYLCNYSTPTPYLENTALEYAFHRGPQGIFRTAKAHQTPWPSLPNHPEFEAYLETQAGGHYILQQKLEELLQTMLSLEFGQYPPKQTESLRLRII